MSAAALPPRKQCIHAIGTDYHCQCPWFAPILLDPYICADCGHGIHTHVDYVSMVVSHYPPTRCAAYVQKTPLTQRCTCEAQLCDHVAINNQYRSEELLPNIVDYFTNNDSIPSNNVNVTSPSRETINNSFAPSSMPFSPTISDTVTFSYDANLGSITEAPVFFPSPHHPFSPSRDARNIPLILTMSSPSASSPWSNIQLDIAQTEAYSPDDSFIQYPYHAINDSYAHQSDGDAMTGSYEHQDHLNVMHDATPEASPRPYA